MPGCRICEIPNDDVIASTELAKAFFSPEPIADLHLVIAVREHRPTFTELTPGEAEELMALARSVAVAAREDAHLDKFYLAAVGDIDQHFHIHLLPKRSDDPPLGRYIFSAEGWAGQLSKRIQPVRDVVMKRLKKV
ncbi:MAG: HIT family protein [Acidobacteriota bacterium]